MKLYTSKMEEQGNTKSYNVNEFARDVLINTCLKGYCCDSKSILRNIHKTVLTNNISLSQFIDLLSVKNLQTFNEHHISCVVRIINVLLNHYFKEKLIDHNDKEIREKLFVISSSILLLPDSIYPITSEYESSSPESFEQNKKLNLILSKVVLVTFMDMLFSETGGNDWIQDFDSNNSSLHLSQTDTEPVTNEDKTHQAHSITRFQKSLLKLSVSHIFIFLSSRHGKHQWTNTELNKLCDNAIQCLLRLTRHVNVQSLFCGTADDPAAMFPEGLSCNIFNYFATFFTKDNWKKSITWTHSLIWCITKVKFPYLGQHVPQVVPMLLLLVDDFSIQNKLLGITTLQYVIENVNPADLRLYDHAAVIYDALFKQLFSNNENLYEISLPCLLKILCVIEYKSDITDITFTLFDKTFEKILQNIDFTTSFSTQRIFLRALPGFIAKMGGNVIKHVRKLIDIIASSLKYSDGAEEMLRSYSLVVLQQTITVSWPVLKRYELIIFKMLLKLLIDLHSSNKLCNEQAKQKLVDQVHKLLLSMRSCYGISFDKLLKEAVTCDVDERYENVKQLFQSVLEAEAGS